MKPCKQSWRDRLIALALGAALDSAVRETACHLATCPTCRSALAALERERDHIEIATEELVRHQPSTEFRSRVLAAVANGGVRGHGWDLLGWAAAVVVVSVAVGMALFPAVVVDRNDEGLPALPDEAMLIGSWRSPTASLTRPPVESRLGSPLRVGELYFDLGGVPAMELEDQR